MASALRSKSNWNITGISPPPPPAHWPFGPFTAGFGELLMTHEIENELAMKQIQNHPRFGAVRGASASGPVQVAVVPNGACVRFAADPVTRNNWACLRAMRAAELQAWNAVAPAVGCQ